MSAQANQFKRPSYSGKDSDLYQKLDFMEIAIDKLNDLSIDYAYEKAINPDMSDVCILGDGRMTIYINDDYHPPGMYFYKSSAKTRDKKLALIKERCGDHVLVPVPCVVGKGKNEALASGHRS